MDKHRKTLENKKKSKYHMSMQDPTGLFNYPITKACMVFTAVVPLIAAVTDYKYIFLAQFDPFIVKYHQYHRLFIFQLCALNESDVILLMLVWYHYRHLERLFGSYKYINMIILTLIYTTSILVVVNMIANIILPVMLLNRLPTGTFPTVIALFHFYKQYTPQIYDVNLLLTRPWSGKNPNNSFSWRINNQVFLNLIIVMLLLNQGLTGVFCGFFSWIIGIFMDRGLLPGVDHWRIPFLIHIQHGGETLTSQRNYHIPSALSQGNNRDSLTPTPNQDMHPDDEPEDEPQRSLGTQFLDTFRR